MDAKSLVANFEKLPSLPTIYHEISDAINDPKVSTTHIGDVISRDTGLSARLLRIANSPMFNSRSKADTISQAIMVIGVQQIRDLALGTCVLRLFKGISEYLVNMDLFWRHSLGCALVARTLAAHKEELNVEHFFVAGLLHDIGRIITYLKMPNQAQKTLHQARSSGELLYKVEQNVFGFDHGDVGGALLQTWRLPKSLSDSVTFHHMPLLSKTYPTEAAIIHIADVITNAMQLGTSGEIFVPPLDLEAFRRTGLTQGVVEPTLKEVDRQFDDIVKSFLH